MGQITKQTKGLSGGKEKQTGNKKNSWRNIEDIKQASKQAENWRKQKNQEATN